MKLTPTLAYEKLNNHMGDNEHLIISLGRKPLTINKNPDLLIQWRINGKDVQFGGEQGQAIEDIAMALWHRIQFYSRTQSPSRQLK